MNGNVSQSKFVLEVIACSVADAVAAEKGGADRLEIISDFNAGGYTPSLDLVREIRSKVSLPLRVMLREQPCYGLTELISIERVCCVANELNKMKIDGVVLGFLQRARVDVGLTKRILSCAPDLRATFHHAFEDTADKAAAIGVLKQIGQVDRILSHGGYDLWSDRVANLAMYAKAAGPEIAILAGGRIDREMIKVIRENCDISEFHVGSAARENGHVTESRVELLAEAVHGVYV